MSTQRTVTQAFDKTKRTRVKAIARARRLAAQRSNAGKAAAAANTNNTPPSSVTRPRPTFQALVKAYGNRVDAFNRHIQYPTQPNAPPTLVGQIPMLIVRDPSAPAPLQ